MAHRPPPSLSSNNNLAPPQRTTTPGQRRMTSPSLPPPGSLNLPEPVYGQREASHSPRPPSPLRNGFIPQFADPVDSDEGEEDNDDEDWGPDKYRSTSPAASVTQFASNLANRVNSLLASPAPSAASFQSGHMTDAELEADAERDRDRSRREAERILTQEANERKAVEERVLALMHSPRGGGALGAGNALVPPQPVRSQTMPAASPPSPSASQKENSGGGWWAAAKNRLTPTKEPLTPAQQVIHEAKTREKDVKVNGKGKEWEGQARYSTADSAAVNLGIPGNNVTPRKPISPSPSTPTLNNSLFRPQPPPDLSPSPMRSSPSREPPPLYAQFNGAGTLDVPGTLLVIARRFEKLEKWTVGHVRALEERMSDVERWLVDKEKERERDKASLSTLDLTEGNGSSHPHPHPHTDHNATNAKTIEELHEMREEVTELQGRVGELGREVAKLATAPANLSSGPASRSPAIVSASLTPQPSSSAAVSVSSSSSSSSAVPPAPPDLDLGMLTPRRAPNFTARDSTTPPLASTSPNSTLAMSPTRRLPYPTGDYATPPDSGILDRGAFASPPGSPPPPAALSATRPLNIPGLPNPSTHSGGSYTTASSLSSSVSSYGSLVIPRATSSPAQSQRSSPSNSGDLPVPKRLAERPTSVSPTPRKRYTVALGGPITDPSRRLASSPEPKSTAEEEEEEGAGETIGRSVGRLISPQSQKQTQTQTQTQAQGSKTSAADRRLRTQSAYISPSPKSKSSTSKSGPANGNGIGATPSPSPGTLNRLRSRSTDRFGASSLSTSSSTSSFASNKGETGGVFSGGKFVDPLVLRKQEKAKGKAPTARGGVKKVPVGQLVAFFDGDR